MIRGSRAITRHAWLFAVLSTAGCSAGSGPPDAEPGGGGGPGGTHGGAGTSPGGGGSTLAPGAGGLAWSGSGSGSGAASNGGGPGACFATTAQAENVTTTVEIPVTTTVTKAKPFDMFVMYDQSGSMNEQTPVGNKWSAIKAALNAFVTNPANGDVGFGIQYFPSAAPTCAPPGGLGCTCIPFVNVCFSQGGGSCNAADYAKPDIAIAPLGTNAGAVTASLNAHGPGGGTPTAPALAGALQYAEAWAAAHPDRPTIVVLATDGDPSGCPGNSVQDVANVAASGASKAPPVRTFVVGVGSSLVSLDSIAAAGGSTRALIVDAANGDPTRQFLDAMNKIRETVTTTETRTETRTETKSSPVPCEFAIPSPPDGKDFDPGKVNVEYALGGETQRIGATGAKGECAALADGWYYDDPSGPAKIVLCPQTCARMQSETGASLQLLFGCKTENAVR